MKIRDNKEFARNPQAVIFACKPPKKRCEMLGLKIKLAIIKPAKAIIGASPTTPTNDFQLAYNKKLLFNFKLPYC